MSGWWLVFALFVAVGIVAAVREWRRPWWKDET